MALEPLRIIKRWFKKNQVDEKDWDEIADKTSSWSLRTNNNLKQIGLDLNGDSYDFNNVGRATQTSSIIARLDAVDNAQRNFSVRNIGIDTATVNLVKIIGADGNDLSASNIGFVSFNQTSTPGQLITRQLTSNIELNLTGTHWGFDTLGDFSDVRLTVMLIDDGTDAVLGVALEGGRETVTSADAETVNTSVNAAEKVYVSSAIGSTSSAIDMAWVNADFDDTGNTNGEDYWEIQILVGDINIGLPGYVQGEIRF